MLWEPQPKLTALKELHVPSRNVKTAVRYLKINFAKSRQESVTKIHKIVEKVNFVVGEPTLISVSKQIKQNHHRQPKPQLVVIQKVEGIT